MDQTPTTHTRSFGGEAVTIDVEPSQIPRAKHIVGDASAYDFASKYDIKHALLERLPTENHRCVESSHTSPYESCVKNPSDRLKENYIGAVIENISKAMKSGAILEIEWDPYICDMKPASYSRADFTVNPFHGLIHHDCLGEALNAIALQESTPDMIGRSDWLAAKKSIEGHKPNALREFYMKVLRETIALYHSLGVGNSAADLRQRLQLEVIVVEQATSRHSNIFMPCNILYASSDEFFNAFHCVKYVPCDAPFGRQTLHYQDGKTLEGRVYSITSFQQESHVNTVLASVAVEHNKPY
eukprot:gene26314-32879_t